MTARSRSRSRDAPADREPRATAPAPEPRQSKPVRVKSKFGSHLYGYDDPCEDPSHPDYYDGRTRPTRPSNPMAKTLLGEQTSEKPGPTAKEKEIYRQQQLYEYEDAGRRRRKYAYEAWQEQERYEEAFAGRMEHIQECGYNMDSY